MVCVGSHRHPSLLAAPFLPYRQSLFSVEAKELLVAHLEALTLQQDTQVPITKAEAFAGHNLQPFSQPGV